MNYSIQISTMEISCAIAYLQTMSCVRTYIVVK